MCHLVSTRLDQSISLPLSFLTHEFRLHILGVPMDLFPFVVSFVSKAFKKDFNMIISLPMFADPQATFAMLSFCYA
jgi:hypothetical protein